MKHIILTLLLSLSYLSNAEVLNQSDDDDTFYEALGYYNIGDYEQAFKLYLISAERGASDAQYRVAEMYSIGQGVLMDKDEAFKWYKISAEQGYTKSQLLLATMYSNGDGVLKNEKEALKWYKKSAKRYKYDAIVEYMLTRVFRDKPKGTSDDKEIFNFYRELAKQGHPEGQRMLGLMYAVGEGVAKDEKEALIWIKKSASQGYRDSQTILGGMYTDGIGVLNDGKEAFEWFKKSAELGDKDAQTMLGLFYADGIGIAKDEKEALKWLKISAKKSAQENGREMVKLHEKLAEQGNADAQNNLANMYCYGEQILRNLKKCSYWAQEADKNGKDVKELWEKYKLWDYME